MIHRHHDRGRNQHAPIAVEGENNERSEDMKMRFDAAARQGDQQSGHQRLRDRDDVARDKRAGPHPSHPDREKADRAAQEDGGPDVKVDLAGRPGPGRGRDEERDENSKDPLKEHQLRKQAVGVPMDLLPMLVIELLGPLRRIVRAVGAQAYRKHTELGPVSARLARAQPKTSVRVRGGSWLFTSEMMALSPALSPACPREPVMPPLKSSLPSLANKSVCPEVSAPNRPASVPSISNTTVTPGMDSALRRRLVSSQARPAFFGVTKSTYVATLPWSRAMICASSPTLAAVHGQRG